MARKTRQRKRFRRRTRRRTRRRRGGTNLFGKDQNHETPRMRINRMKRNMDKEKAYQKAKSDWQSSSLESKRKALRNMGHASRNVLQTAGRRRRRRSRRRTRRRR